MTRRVLPPAVVLAAVLAAVALLAWWALQQQGAAPDAPSAVAPVAAPPEARTVPETVRADRPARARRPEARAAAPRPRAQRNPVERIRGLVVREDDAPLSGAAVQLHVAGADSVALGTWLLSDRTYVRDVAVRPPTAETTTSADGRFEFRIAGEDVWRIDVAVEGEVVASMSGVGPGEWRIVAQAAGQRVSVLLFDAETGSGISGAQIRVWPASTEFPPIRTVKTAEDGAASFSLLGNEVAVAFADGYRPAMLALDASTSLQRIPLTKAAEMRGVVVDAAGKPVEGASVLASRVVEGDDAGAVLAVTDAEGAFRVPGGGAVGQEAKVEVYADGFASWSGEARPGDELRIVLERLGVIEGDVVDADRHPAERFAAYGLEFEGGTFRLESMNPGIVWVGGVAWSGGGQFDVGRHVVLRPGETLRGVRLAPGERGRSRVRVRVEVPEEAGMPFVVVRLRTPSGEDVAEQVTEPDATGEAHVADFTPLDLPVGTRLVASASREDANGDSGELALIESAPVEVVTWDVAPEKIPTIVVGTPARIPLRFVDTSGAEIEETADLLEVSGGAVRLATGVLLVAPDARFRLRAVFQGWRPHDAEHAVTEARDGVLTIRLDPGESIRGRLELEPVVAEPDGAGVLRGPWEFQVVQGPVLRDVRLEEDLTFEVRGLDAGPAVLRLIEGGAVVHEQTVRVAPGGTDVGVVRVPPLVRVKVRLTDTRGRPVPDAALLELSSTLDDWSSSADDGVVEFLIPRGRRTLVRAFDDTRCSRATWIDGSAGAAPVDVPLERCARLVVRSGDRPLAWSEIELSASSEDGTDLRLKESRAEDDAFTYANFPPGRAVLKVTWRGRTTEHRVDAAPGAFVEVDLGR